MSWFYDSEGHVEIQPWFPLPTNLINKGEEWIPEIQQNATVCLPNFFRVEEVYILLSSDELINSRTSNCEYIIYNKKIFVVLEI